MMRTISGILLFCFILICLGMSGCLDHASRGTSSSLNPGDPSPSCSPASCIPGSDGYKPQPTYEGAIPTPLGSMNIKEVVSWAGPELKLPERLPEGYLFAGGTIWENQTDGRRIVRYSNGSANLDIGFSYHTDILYCDFFTGNPEKTCVNGKEVQVFASGSTTQVRWCDGPVIRWITGTVPREDIVMIAGSVVAPDAVNLTSDTYVRGPITPHGGLVVQTGPNIPMPTPTPTEKTI